jgi:hypothetical protein
MVVTVNPFLNEIKVSKRYSDEEVVLFYQASDEWIAFSFDGNDYDMHFLYDRKLEIAIYQIIDGDICYETSKKIKTVVKY